MKEGRELVKEAIADAKSLQEAAMERAKNDIVESLAPAVRKLLEQKLTERGSKLALDPDDAPNGTREQKKDYANEELELEAALQELFPKGEKNMDKKSEKMSKKDEALETEQAEVTEEVNEEIEIAESELKKVYEAALQTEVQVKKGFGDITNFVELGGKTAGNDHDPADPKAGKQGEKMFNDGEVPAKKDWIPEAKQLQAMLQKGLAENKALRENLRKAAAMIETLGKKLHEVNLFNAKVLHVNKILNSGAKLTREQKTFVMESIDKARSIGEVKMVFETIVGSIKTSAAAVNESRNARPPKANAARPRTTGTPTQEVLSESVDKGSSNAFSRVQELAGLLK